MDDCKELRKRGRAIAAGNRAVERTAARENVVSAGRNIVIWDGRRRPYKLDWVDGSGGLTGFVVSINFSVHLEQKARMTSRIRITWLESPTLPYSKSFALIQPFKRSFWIFLDSFILIRLPAVHQNKHVVSIISVG
jgi:hypothetical protein